MQPASDYISVKVATFASLSNLLKRFSSLPFPTEIFLFIVAL